jgi:hypothetical protein
MSIIEARATEQAQRFYDWALTPDAQKLGFDAGKQLRCRPTRPPLPPSAPDLTKMKLVDYDYVKYGSSANGSACSRNGIPTSARCRAAMRRRAHCDHDHDRFSMHVACDGAPPIQLQ